MAVDFSTLLTTEQKKQLLEARIAQFANEGYQHSLNKKVAEEQQNESGIQAADEAMAILSTAIEAHQTELASLPTE